MSKNVTLQDKDGNDLYPETTSSQVKDSTNEQTLDDWREDVDSSLESMQTAATEAQTQAQAAVTTANEAKEAAESAKETAEGIEATATSAATQAQSAVETATTAQETANSIAATATAAQEAAESAKTTAEAANTTATAAQETANTIAATATAAQEAATAAQETATAAKETADGVATTASEAKSTAEAASTAAATAQETAEAAKTAAESASAAAAAAQSAADTAQTTATAAQETATTATTTATSAQTSAESAVSTATAAQTTANEAKEAATTAQSTAESAQTAATAAQETATQAQTTATAAQEAIPDVSNFSSKNDLDSKFAETLLYNMGDFDTLDAATLNLGYHEIYNNMSRRVLYFTVGGTETGIVINSTGDAVDGLAYTSKQYLYYDGHRYVRTVRRGSDGNVTSPDWTLDDAQTLYPGKGVQVAKLLALTTESTSDEVKEALTHPNGDGVLTKDDLDMCVSTGMFVQDYNTNVQVHIGRTVINSHYVFTYVGTTTPTESTAANFAEPVVASVLVDISDDGTYSVVKAPSTAAYLTEDSAILPLEAYIPELFKSPANTDTSIKTAETILGYFGCETVDELIQKIKGTTLVSLLYLNSGYIFYHIPVQFIEVVDNNCIHLVAMAIDPTDNDAAARIEVKMYLDGTIAEGSSNNIYVSYTHLAAVSDTTTASSATITAGTGVSVSEADGNVTVSVDEEWLAAKVAELTATGEGE